MRQDDHFWSKFFSILIPVTLQQVLLNSLSFVDTLMISRLGSDSIAAVGLANQLSFLIGLFFYGTSTACSIFVSQYYGAKDDGHIRKTTSLALSFGLIGGCLFCLLATVFPAPVMGVYSNDPLVITLGVTYLRWVGSGFIAWAFTQVIGIGLRSTGHAGIPLLASVVSMVTNIILNYILIFGHFGAPVLGVGGAAIATTVSRWIEAVIVVAAAYLIKSPCRLLHADDFHWSGSFLRHVAPTALPVVLNEFFWALGTALYRWAYSRQGTEVVAVVNVSESVSGLFLTAIFAVSSVTLVMIGQKIGEGDTERTRLYCRRFSWISFVTGLTMGCFLVLASRPLVGAFHLYGEIADMTCSCLLSIALLLPWRSYGYALVTGIMRGGGDTSYAAVTELGCVWLSGVPMALIGSAWLGLPMRIVYLMVGLEDVSKCVFGTLRIRSGRWIHNVAKG